MSPKSVGVSFYLKVKRRTNISIFLPEPKASQLLAPQASRRIPSSSASVSWVCSSCLNDTQPLWGWGGSMLDSVY